VSEICAQAALAFELAQRGARGMTSDGSAIDVDEQRARCVMRGVHRQDVLGLSHHNVLSAWRVAGLGACLFCSSWRGSPARCTRTPPRARQRIGLASV
jgi:hypothetical protein